MPWRAVGILCALLASGGCGTEVSASWTDVVAAGEHADSSVETVEHVLADGRTVRLAAEGGGVRLELALARGDWEQQVPPWYWLARVPLPLPKADRTNSSVFQLAAGARSFAQVPYRILKKGGGEERFPPHSFWVGKDGVLLRLPRNEEPAAEMTLTYVLGAAGANPGRVLGPHFSGRGFQVWPGQTLRVGVDVPEGSVLRFATTLDPEVGRASVTGVPTVYRVLQDGEPVFEHVVTDPTEAAQAWHAVALPRSGQQSELAFTVHGTFANTCFLDPVLGPRDVGTPGRRPWGDRRPDILVFLADTFRADGMRAYGGKLGLTPNLDRLAEEGLLFRRAWSVGSYTLPAHATMFSGLMPMQAGLEDSKSVMPDELVTVAELLSAAGYRTGAFTAGGFVSRCFGFDQGFAIFQEDRAQDSATAAERALAFLAADDGRPAFVFVHTYQTHKPYLVSDETRSLLGRRLGITGDFAEIEGRLRELSPRGNRLPHDPREADAAAAIVRETLAHYWGVVADLDRGFGRLQRALAQRGWFEHGRLVFTSDHGEAFGEHGDITHGGAVFEEKIRIPLLILGQDLGPRVVDHAASLLDLAPTLADMAGIPARPEWTGTSLLSLAADRPVFSFGMGAESTLAVVEGARKVIGYAVGRAVDNERVLGAFDLAIDPLERRAIAPQHEAWPRELLRRFAPQLEHALAPVVAARAALLDAADLEELHKLGYVEGFDE